MSVVIREGTYEDQGRWDEFVTQSSHASFLQSWQWGEVQGKLGARFWRLLAEDNGEIVATALLIKRELPFGRCWLYVPRGPIIDAALSDVGALMNRFVEYAERENALFIRFDPAVTSEDAYPFLSSGQAATRKAEREIQPQQTLLLDLNPSAQQLLAHMKSKTRYNVRLAERKGVTVRFSRSPEDVDVFLKLARRVQDRSSFRFHPDEYYRAILDQADAEIAIAEYSGEALAAHIMVYYGLTATYAHGASSDEHRNLQASTLLYWNTITRAKERGCNIYDFFGVAPSDADGSHPWSGVTRIKKGFGGIYVSYVGAYDYVLDNASYHTFAVIRKIRNLL